MSKRENKQILHRLIFVRLPRSTLCMKSSRNYQNKETVQTVREETKDTGGCSWANSVL